MSRKASLAEMMGSAGASGITLSKLPQVLGDAMPELPRNSVGRHRLIRALQQRFGDGFRALPGVAGIIKEFDADVKFEQKLGAIRAIKPKVKNG